MNNIIKKLENEVSKIQCTSCRRVIEFTDNDEYRCRYGLTSVINDTKPKCKYFKRNAKYITCKGIGKIRSSLIKGHKTEYSYKRGKFNIIKVY